MGGTKIKVLLIAPYVTGMLEGFEELGISYIAAVIRKKGHEVMLIGNHVDLIDYEQIAVFKPDIAGITVYNETQKASYDIIHKLCQLLGDIYICVGGTQPTYAGEAMLQECKEIDFAIRGEGEFVWTDLISAIEEKKDYRQIRGLVYRNGEKIIANSAQQYIEDLDNLPFPARDILLSKKLNVAQISTSRGCTGRCSFCSSQLFWKKWRGRSVKSIVDEIEALVNTYNIRMLSFIDSSFEDPGVKFGRLQSIAQEILNRGLFITYFADVRAEFHKEATSELMRVLKASGLVCVMVGIETNNESDIKVYNKKASLEDNEKTIKLFTSYGIVVKCGFINFNPYSTFEGLRKNIDFLERHSCALNYECTASRFMMYKGTALYTRVKEDFLVTGDDVNERGYTYVDKRVEVFADYVYDYLRQKSKLGTDFRRIRYFNPYYQILIASCQRQFDSDNHLKAHNTLKHFLETNQSKINELCCEINGRVAAWFRELLELAESKWDPCIADEKSRKYLNADYIQGMADELDMVKNKLYINILRLGHEYDKFLVKIS